MSEQHFSRDSVFSRKLVTGTALLAIVVIAIVISYRVLTFSSPRTSFDYDSLPPEVAVVAARADADQRQQDLLVEIVMWSLGSVVTVAGLIVGANLFQNVFVAERAMRSIQDEAERQISIAKQELETLSNTTNATLSSHFLEHKESIQSTLTTSSNTLNDQLEPKLDALRKELIDRINKTTTSAQNRLTQHRIRTLEYQISTNERLNEWIFRNGYILELLRIGLSSKDEHVIGDALDELEKVVSHDGYYLYRHEQASLIELLSQAPAAREGQVRTILSIVDTKVQPL